MCVKLDAFNFHGGLPLRIVGDVVVAVVVVVGSLLLRTTGSIVRAVGGLCDRSQELNHTRQQSNNRQSNIRTIAPDDR